jgi:hypothetical protein
VRAVFHRKRRRISAIDRIGLLGAESELKTGAKPFFIRMCSGTRRPPYSIDEAFVKRENFCW